MEEQQEAESRQRYVPTYQKVWAYPWVIHGIGDFTFWRPVKGWAAVAFMAAALVVFIVMRRIGVRLGPESGTLIYLGVPGLVGWYVSNNGFNGKRLDRWLIDYLTYFTSPKRYERYEALAEPEVTVMVDTPVLIDNSVPWWLRR